MIKWFEMSGCPFEEIPKKGELFRIGPDVGKCISVEYDEDMQATICGMDTDFWDEEKVDQAERESERECLEAERRAEQESLGGCWW